MNKGANFEQLQFINTTFIPLKMKKKLCFLGCYKWGKKRAAPTGKEACGIKNLDSSDNQRRRWCLSVYFLGLPMSLERKNYTTTSKKNIRVFMLLGNKGTQKKGSNIIFS